MQEADAERRIQILRGENPDPLPPPPTEKEKGEATAPSKRNRHDDGPGHERKRRRIAGEDDTDRDIRYAKEDTAVAASAKTTLQLKSQKTSSAPLTDGKGHINLFPVAPTPPPPRPAGLQLIPLRPSPPRTNQKHRSRSRKSQKTTGIRRPIYHAFQQRGRVQTVCRAETVV